MTLDALFRDILRDEIRTAVREEIQAQRQPAPPPAASSLPTLLSTKAVAEACGVKPPAVVAWIHSGRLVARKAGHQYVVTPADFERFLANEKEAGAPIDPDQHMALVIGRINGKRSP